MASKYGTKSSEKVEQAMHERKRGTLRSGGSGKKVTSKKQAIAIGLSEARREGGKVPSKKASSSSKASKSSKSSKASKSSAKKAGGSSKKSTSTKSRKSTAKSSSTKKSSAKKSASKSSKKK